MHHILGFNSQAWSKFYDRTTKEFIPESEVLIIEQSRFGNRVKYDPILKWARDHYDCQTADGIPLENGGQSGVSLGHWDRAIVGNDLVKLKFQKFQLTFLDESCFLLQHGLLRTQHRLHERFRLLQG
jgi:hypothetical protein